MKPVLLLVDDDASLQELIRSICRRHLAEFRVLTVATAAEALQRAAAEKPGVVVLDVKLPDMDGFEVCRRLKTDPALRDTRVLLISGTYTAAHDRLCGLECGADGYLVKPFDLKELVLQIRSLFRWWHMEQVQREQLERLVARRTQALEAANESLRQEVAERQRVEAALHASKQELQYIIDNTHDVIFRIDLQGRYIFASAAAERLTGYPVPQLLDMNMLQVIAPEYHPQVLERLQQRIAGQLHEQTFAFEIVHRDGHRLWAELNTTSVRDAAGRLVAVQGVARDITERRQMLDQLQRSQKMEAVGQLAGGIAHDFNNLLQAILGFADMLLAGPALQPRQRDDLLEIRKAALHAAELTRQLLAYSRRQMIVPTVLDLNTLVADSQQMLQRLLGEDIRIRTGLMPDLPRVKADPGQIQQVLLNLAVNARDAMPDGGRLTISTTSVVFEPQDARAIADARTGSFVCLAMADTGRGMSKEVLAHIFEPFFTTKGLGTGLGLSVVYGVAQQHQGWVNVYSQEGLGSTFKLYLPVYAMGAAAVTAPEPAIASPLVPGRGECILLVEDDPDVLHLATRVLRGAGYEIHAARSLQEGRDVFGQQQLRVRLLFSDVVLADGNGLELANAIRRQQPDLPVLLCSGYTDERARWSDIEQQKFHYLQKPYPTAVLLKTIRQILDQPAAAP